MKGEISFLYSCLLLWCQDHYCCCELYCKEGCVYHLMCCNKFSMCSCTRETTTLHSSLWKLCMEVMRELWNKMYIVLLSWFHFLAIECIVKNRLRIIMTFIEMYKRLSHLFILLFSILIGINKHRCIHVQSWIISR